MNPLLEVKNKRFAVVGIKRSGIAAIELLRSHEAEVWAVDAQAPTESDRNRLEELGVRYLPQQVEVVLADAQPEVLVISPGVPIDAPFVVAMQKAGVRVMGEVELASFFLQGPVLGVTGSNGKTTTTSLIGHLLRECGVAAQVGGNIGIATAALVATSRNDGWNVLELSSFQLESIDHFRADIAVCLNVTPDHLDRHITFEAYAAAKGRLFQTQVSGDKAVLNADDSTCLRFASETKADCFWFSSQQPVKQGLYLAGEQLYWNGTPFLNRSAIPLPGLHNVENVMAATIAAHLAGAELPRIAAAIQTFSGVEHRLQLVRELDGVRYYNDSKATNVDATLKAVAAFDNPLWVVLGGKDKGASYEPLRDPLRAKGKAALLIGAPPPYPYAAWPRIERELAGTLPMHYLETLEAAVRYAHANAAPGDVVLLAPACASFDQYANFEERGADFRRIVTTLEST
jgi:UDP-N-acetylmuramoylalanine--D-glutamate ligase